MATKKVLITGSKAVGKTALFNRFIHGDFGTPTQVAIGLKVGKKKVVVEGREVSLILWDLKGDASQGKVPRTYFLGAVAVVYVYDLSRLGSRKNLEEDLALIRRTIPGCLIRVVGNKKDLLNEEELQELPPGVYLSAKTGENVEAFFLDIGQELMSGPPGE